MFGKFMRIVLVLLQPRKCSFANLDHRHFNSGTLSTKPVKVKWLLINKCLVANDCSRASPGKTPDWTNSRFHRFEVVSSMHAFNSLSATRDSPCPTSWRWRSRPPDDKNIKNTCAQKEKCEIGGGPVLGQTSQHAETYFLPRKHLLVNSGTCESSVNPCLGVHDWPAEDFPSISQKGWYNFRTNSSDIKPAHSVTFGTFLRTPNWSKCKDPGLAAIGPSCSLSNK